MQSRPIGGSITSRLIVVLTLCAAVIIGLGMLLDYRLSRAEILERLEFESEEAIRAAVIDLENWLDGVEASTLMLARLLAQQEIGPERMEQLLKDVVAVNEDIFGAAIALVQEEGADSLGFAPYYYHRDGELEFVDMAGPTDNYQQQPWYIDAVAAGAPLWVEPYFDEAGARVMMTTFAVPVYRLNTDSERALYAVVTADVTLEELRGYLRRLRLGSNGFGILLSRSGVLLSGNNRAQVMRHYSETVSGDIDLTSWEIMFNAALAGEVVSREVACPHTSGDCIIRLGSLNTTGWPLGIVYSEDEIIAPLREYEIKTAIIGLVTLVLMAVAVIIVTRRLTKPLTALAQSSDRIAGGDLDAPLPPARGDDEVARLIQSFGAMQRDLKSFIADLKAATARRSRMEGELAAAREIQMAMLPHGGEANERDDAFHLWARVLPARSVGGDLYSYLRRDRALFIAVGDVSDKGVPAALFMARAISLIQQLAAGSSSPSESMAVLNNALVSGNDNCMFVTLFLGVLDLDSLELCFACAGHTPPGLLRDGVVNAIEQQRGPALGLASNIEFPANSLQLRAGDRLAIYTDGIDEAFNDHDEMFGVERFDRELLAGAALPVSGAGAAIFDALAAFAGDRPRSDDISLMLLDIPAHDTELLRAVQRFQLGPGLTSRAQSWLRQTLSPLQLAERLLGDLALVLEEVVTNIQKYSGLPEEQHVGVELTADTGKVQLQVSDNGAAFDPLGQASRAELGSGTDDAPIGGLGLHLITSLTDQQNYRRQDGCNILLLTRLIGQGTAATGQNKPTDPS